MGDLKTALKESKQLLSTGKSQEVIDLLQVSNLQSLNVWFSLL